jgi:hypothetical protein
MQQNQLPHAFSSRSRKATRKARFSTVKTRVLAFKVDLGVSASRVLGQSNKVVTALFEQSRRFFVASDMTHISPSPLTGKGLRLAPDSLRA